MATPCPLGKTYKNIFIEADDTTYLYGNYTYVAEIDDETNEPLEPYLLNFGVIPSDISEDEKEMRQAHDITEKIWYYPSRDKFVICRNNKIFKIVRTCTCWSDDWDEYRIEDDKVVSYFESYHGGHRSLTINYKEGKVENFSYHQNRKFGMTPVFNAPTLEKLIPDLEYIKQNLY